MLDNPEAGLRLLMGIGDRSQVDAVIRAVGVRFSFWGFEAIWERPSAAIRGPGNCRSDSPGPACEPGAGLQAEGLEVVGVAVLQEAGEGDAEGAADPLEV